MTKLFRWVITLILAALAFLFVQFVALPANAETGECELQLWIVIDGKPIRPWGCLDSTIKCQMNGDCQNTGVDHKGEPVTP